MFFSKFYLYISEINQIYIFHKSNEYGVKFQFYDLESITGIFYTTNTIQNDYWDINQ